MDQFSLLSRSLLQANILWFYRLVSAAKHAKSSGPYIRVYYKYGFLLGYLWISYFKWDFSKTKKIIIIYFYGMTVMKAFEINLRSFVGHTTKRGCCGVLKDQWLAIAVGFVISLLRFKSTRFHDQTAEVWEFVDAIRSKKQRTSRSDFCFRSLFLAPLGTPFDRLLRASNIFRNAKKCSRLLLQYRPPKRVPKKWFCLESTISTWSGFQKGGGASSFYGMKLG